MESNNQLDELFKTRFESLPTDKSAGDWDTPSPRVWAGISTEVQTPSTGSGSGGSYQWLYWAAGVVSIGAIAFMLLRTPQAPTQMVPSSTPPVSAPAQLEPKQERAPAEPAETIATKEAVEPQKTAKPKAKTATEPEPQTAPATPEPARNNLERRRQGQ
jgi:cytoskeletal protein RodZ